MDDLYYELVDGEFRVNFNMRVLLLVKKMLVMLIFLILYIL